MKRLLALTAVIVLIPVLTGCSFNTSGLNTINHGQCVTADKVYAYVGDTITWTMDMYPNTVYGGINPQIPDYKRSFNIYCNNVLFISSGIISSYSYSAVVSKAGSYRADAFLLNEHDLHIGDGGLATVTAPLVITGIVPSKTSGKTGDAITWTVKAAGGFGASFGLKYSWGVLRSNGVINISGEGKTANTYSYTPDLPGDYSVEVWVSDGVSSIQGTGGKIKITQDLAITSVSVKKLGAESAAGDKTDAIVGERIRWFANVKGGTGLANYQYVFDIYKDGKIYQDNNFAGSKFYGWTETLNQPGSYYVIAGVFDGKNYAYCTSPTTIFRGPLAIVSVKSNRTSAPVGAQIIWTIKTSGGLNKKNFGFQLFKNGLPIGSAFSSASIIHFTSLSSAGDYFMRGSASDASGAPPCTMDSAHIQVKVSSALAVKSIQVDKIQAPIGEKITWTAAAMGGSGGVLFKFNIYKDDKLLKTGTFSQMNQFDYTPTEAGIYKTGVYVKDTASASYSPVYSAETVVFALVPLSGALDVLTVEVSPTPLFPAINFPDNVTIQITPIPAATKKPTPQPTVHLITPAPVPVDPEVTDFMYIIVTGFIFPVPTPTAYID